MMYCINCGQQVSTESENCPHCNSRLPATEQTKIMREAATLIASEEKTRISSADARAHYPTDPQTTTTHIAKEMETGQVLGNRYEIKECIGSGGMGAIYTA